MARDQLQLKTTFQYIIPYKSTPYPKTRIFQGAISGKRFVHYST